MDLLQLYRLRTVQTLIQSYLSILDIFLLSIGFGAGLFSSFSNPELLISLKCKAFVSFAEGRVEDGREMKEEVELKKKL